MTHQDIYTKFMIEYDKANVTSSYPSLTEYEVATVLDKAYHALIAQKFTGNNFRRVAFELDVKNIEDLKPIITTAVIPLTDDNTISSNVKRGLLEKDHLYFISAMLLNTVSLLKDKTASILSEEPLTSTEVTPDSETLKFANFTLKYDQYDSIFTTNASDFGISGATDDYLWVIKKPFGCITDLSQGGSLTESDLRVVNITWVGKTQNEVLDETTLQTFYNEFDVESTNFTGTLSELNELFLQNQIVNDNEYIGIYSVESEIDDTTFTVECFGCADIVTVENQVVSSSADTFEILSTNILSSTLTGATIKLINVDSLNSSAVVNHYADGTYPTIDTNVDAFILYNNVPVNKVGLSIVPASGKLSDYMLFFGDHDQQTYYVKVVINRQPSITHQYSVVKNLQIPVINSNSEFKWITKTIAGQTSTLFYNSLYYYKVKLYKMSGDRVVQSTSIGTLEPSCGTISVMDTSLMEQQFIDNWNDAVLNGANRIELQLFCKNAINDSYIYVLQNYAIDLQLISTDDSDDTYLNPPIDNIMTRPIPVKLVSHDTAQKFYATKYNLPWVKVPVCCIEGKYIDVVYDSYDNPNTGKSLTLTYIKLPNKFVKNLDSINSELTQMGNKAVDNISYIHFTPSETINSKQLEYLNNIYTFELSDSAAEELISLAVAFALENVESPRLNTKLNMKGLES